LKKEVISTSDTVIAFMELEDKWAILQSEGIIKGTLDPDKYFQQVIEKQKRLQPGVSDTTTVQEKLKEIIQEELDRASENLKEVDAQLSQDYPHEVWAEL
jgi:hypothetical protein